MKITYFRFVNGSEPVGYVGLACYDSKLQLFNIIDEFGDPYSVQLKPINTGAALCWHRKVLLEENDIPIEIVESEFELSEQIYEDLGDFNEPNGWATPNWS